MDDDSKQPENDRYRRQSAFAELGKAGQSRLASSRIGIVGVGALGSVIAERLVRAGVGFVRLIDRDWVEWDNLPRQTLFTESDAQQRLPKAISAAHHLEAINCQTTIDAQVVDLVPANALELLADVDLILDGTDNFETRFLINDVSLEREIPWLHGGCIGASGQMMACIPKVTACFRCLMPEPMPADQQATCDSAGVLGPAVSIIASWQAIEAIKLLSGHPEAVSRKLLTFDFWHNEIRQISIEPLRTGLGCPACGMGRRDFLDGSRSSSTQVLCGRNAVQIHNPDRNSVDLDRLAARLSGLGSVTANPFLLRFERQSNEEDPFTITVFRDGRGIVSGTEDPTTARRLYATWIGQ